MGIGLSFNNGIVFGIEALEQADDSPFSWEILLSLTIVNIHLFGFKQ